MNTNAVGPHGDPPNDDDEHANTPQPSVTSDKLVGIIVHQTMRGAQTSEVQRALEGWVGWSEADDDAEHPLTPA